MTDAAGVLLQLYHEFIDQKRFGEAVKCLLAVCQSTKTLPFLKAACHLAAARIVLDHFDNVAQAKSLLRIAELELRSSKSHYLLKCEVLDALAHCHQLSQEFPQVKDIYLSAIKLCGQGMKSRDTDAVSAWKRYFLFRLAELQLLHGDADEAVELLQQIEKDASATEEDKVLACMSRSIAHLHANQLDAANTDLQTCASLIEAATDGIQDSEAQTSVHQELRAPYFLTYIGMAMASGKLAQLRKDASFPVLDDLYAMAALVEDGGLYSWLPKEALVASGHLLHASLLRQANKSSEAAVHLAEAEEAVDTKLQEVGINIKSKGGESSLASSTLSSAAIFVSLKALILQQRALLALVSSDYMKAATIITQLLGMMDQFPTALAQHHGSLALLLGYYAHVTNEYVAAIKKFKMAKTDGGKQLENMAVLGSVLSGMHRDGSSYSSSVQMLEEHDLRNAESLAKLPMHERAAAQLMSGLLLKQQGDSTGARLHLTKALKQAHSVLGSTQLVAQVLNALAPVQQTKHDVDGAKQMLESAMTLTKTLGDLPSLITTLKRLAVLQQESGDAELAAKTADYIEKKTSELESRLEAVRSSKLHKTILSWGNK